jgi:uncharacterized membrane protein
MRLRFGRIVVIAIAVETLTILLLVVLVAALGPSDAEGAQQAAERLGRWVGPIGGFVLCLVGGWLVAKGAATAHVLHGLMLGGTVAAIDVLLLLMSGSGFELLFAVSNLGRLLAGSVGGYAAAVEHGSRAA